MSTSNLGTRYDEYFKPPPSGFIKPGAKHRLYSVENTELLHDS